MVKILVRPPATPALELRYGSYLRAYGKTYANREEYEQRFRIWLLDCERHQSRLAQHLGIHRQYAELQRFLGSPYSDLLVEEYHAASGPVKPVWLPAEDAAARPGRPGVAPRSRERGKGRSP